NNTKKSKRNLKMSNSSRTTICANCNSRQVTVDCHGCAQPFCDQCMAVHRDELSHQLDNIVNVRNELQQSLSSSNGNEIAFFAKVDEWQRNVINKVLEIAENAKQNIREILVSKTTSYNQKLNQISNEVKQRRQNNDFTENDLHKLREQLGELNDNIKDISKSIEIDTSQSNDIRWDSLIFIVQKEN
ncbi:unnamed protein product, partial [Didymodactylos carnosus]